jgi:methyltransferase (TIGR00027 family)
MSPPAQVAASRVPYNRRMSEPVIRNVSDTARWTAAFRARESERPDALFHDPLARRLAGERGEEIVREVKFGTKHTWSWITRTVLFDQLIDEQLRGGADMVINLAAGLDARPYRMDVAPHVQWIEIDLPEITEYKEAVLANETPKCKLRRVKMDLADRNARRKLFAELGAQASNAVILSEGLAVYLSDEEVGDLARDLSDQTSFRHWILDLLSPALLTMMRKKMGKHLDAANAPLKFAPAEGPPFFAKFGWRVAEVHSMLHSGAKLKRLPLLMRLFALFPPPENGVATKRQPWSGVVLLARERA